jgi:hypothetical protein
VEVERDELVIHLAHETDSRYDVRVFAQRGWVSVWVGDAHDDFNPDDPRKEQRRWTAVAVDFIAEVLTGQVDVEATFRGKDVVSTRLWRRDHETGNFRSLGYVGFLTLARLRLWHPKRVERYRIPDWRTRGAGAATPDAGDAATEQ